MTWHIKAIVLNAAIWGYKAEEMCRENTTRGTEKEIEGNKESMKTVSINSNRMSSAEKHRELLEQTD